MEHETWDAAESGYLQHYLSDLLTLSQTRESLLSLFEWQHAVDDRLESTFTEEMDDLVVFLDVTQGAPHD